MTYRKLHNELHFHGYVLAYDFIERASDLFVKWLKNGIIPHGLIFLNVNTDIMQPILPHLPSQSGTTASAHTIEASSVQQTSRCLAAFAW